MLIKAATVMVVYALVLIGVGALTFHVSPPGSKAITAIVIPGAIGVASIVCAVLTVLGKRDRKLGMIGVHVGLILPVIAAIGTFARLGGSVASADAYNATLRTPQSVLVDIDSGKPTKNTAYQAVGIGASGAISVLAFVALLLHRPTVPKKAEDIATAPAAVSSEPSSA